MGYIGDPIKDFGDYSKQEYHAASPLEIDRLAKRNAGEKPAGLQGYEGISPVEIDRLAKRNAGVKPGLQGYEGISPVEIDRLAKRNASIYPAGLQGYEGISPVEIDRLAKRNAGVKPGLQGFGDEQANISQISHLAVHNRNGTPAGGSLGETDHNAFDGLGDATPNNWAVFFDKASKAITETDIIEALKHAVASVPDDTSADIKASYYRLAIDMLRRRKEEKLYQLNLKRIELQSNLGWLVNPSLPKSGGFDKAIGQAVGKLGNQLAKNGASWKKDERLLGFGSQLKTTLRKVGNFHGLGDVSSTTKMLLILGLGVATGAGVWYLFKKRKFKLTLRRRKR